MPSILHEGITNVDRAAAHQVRSELDPHYAFNIRSGLTIAVFDPFPGGRWYERRIQSSATRQTSPDLPPRIEIQG
jgi:hypothetical protein